MEAILYYNFSKDDLHVGTFFDYITIQDGLLRVEYFFFNGNGYKCLKVGYSLDIDVYINKYYSTTIQDENERWQYYIENQVKENSIDHIEASFNIYGITLSTTQRPNFTIISEPISDTANDSLRQKIYDIKEQYPNAINQFSQDVSSDRIRWLITNTFNI